MREMTRVQQFFKTIASIDSYIGREGRLADFLEEQLTGMGAAVERDDSASRTGSDTGNIIARFDGTVDSATTIFLCSHMDTIGPTGDMVPELREGRFYSNGETVLGADDKAGIAVIIATLEKLQAEKIDYGPIEVVFTVQEEPGLRGATNLNAELKAEYGYILDGDGPVGTIINRAPAKVDLDFSITGQAAHAGICPEEGVNAIVAASAAIARVVTGRIDQETTSNVGTISGGSLRNIVADKAEVAIEVRSASPDKLERECEKIIASFQAAADEYGAELAYEKTYAFKSFAIAETHPAVERASAAARSLSIEPVLWASGGGLDANIFNDRGLTCVALGLGIDDPHSSKESVPVAQLDLGVELLSALLSVDLK